MTIEGPCKINMIAALTYICHIIDLTCIYYLVIESPVTQDRYAFMSKQMHAGLWEAEVTYSASVTLVHAGFTNNIL